MSTPLHAQILNAINSIRPYLYGANLKVLFLKFNGTDKHWDEVVEVSQDFIVSFDRSGNITMMISSDKDADKLRQSTHLVFDSWVYQLTEPAKPEQGPFPMWKATGRPLGNKYVAES